MPTNPATGLQTVFASGVETTYGTPVVVDRFQEIVSETLARQNNVIHSNGLRGGTRNLARGSRRLVASNDAKGDVVYEVATSGFGRHFSQIMGSAGTVAGAGPYTQTFAMGSLQGKSLTLQKQLRDANGTAISTLTYKGARVVDAEFSIAVNKLLELKVTYDCQQETNATAAATASYTNTSLFSFAGASLSVGGVAVANVLDLNVKFTNAQDVARYFLGSSGQKAEPSDNAYPTVTGTMNAEVLDEILYNDFTADTAVEFSATFANGVYSLVINIPEIHLTGKSPNASGVGVIKNAIPFEGAYDGTDPGATLVYTTIDATP